MKRKFNIKVAGFILQFRMLMLIVLSLGYVFQNKKKEKVTFYEKCLSVLRGQFRSDTPSSPRETSGG